MKKSLRKWIEWTCEECQAVFTAAESSSLTTCDCGGDLTREAPIMTVGWNANYIALGELTTPAWTAITKMANDTVESVAA